MRKTGVKAQRRLKRLKKEIKTMITEMRMTRGCSKINSKRSASHVVNTACYSNIKTITTWATVSVLYSRKKQKAMLLKEEILGGEAIEYRHSAFLNW